MKYKLNCIDNYNQAFSWEEYKKSYIYVWWQLAKIASKERIEWVPYSLDAFGKLYYIGLKSQQLDQNGCNDFNEN